MIAVNWLDGVVLLFLLAAVWVGRRIGFSALLLSVVGFFASLLLAGWLFPHILPIHDRTLLTLVNGNLVLICALYGGIRGYYLGRQAHITLKRRLSKRGEAAAGMILAALAMLIAVWLLAAMIGRLPFAGLSNSANDAAIVQVLDRSLPPVPAVFASFNHIINPNSPPHLIIERQPTAITLPNVPNTRTALKAAGASTVRITSFGCGGIVSGSGFIISPQLVMTNAHVIAGVKRPIIKTEGQSYEGRPVLFDANLDVAILRVAGLPGTPLALTNEAVTDGMAVAVTGFPSGNYAGRSGVVRDKQQIFGRNIYDEGLIARPVYEIQAAIEDGDSGAPVVLADGRVAGIVFAKSEVVDGYGYALPTSILQDKMNQARNASQRVSTGACLAS